MPSSIRSQLIILLGFIAILTGYRFWTLLYGQDLYVDEAQYWYWSQHLAWGYFSKPPLIAVLIAITTDWWGDSELAIRSGALLVYPLTCLVIYAIGLQLRQSRVGFVAAVIFISLPSVSLSSTLIATDVLLFLFWALALLFWLRSLETNRWLDWLALGCALGLGLLSKYNMAIFFLAALLSIAWYRQWPLLLNTRAWVAVLVAFLWLVPNLIWNGQHDWPTFAHTAQIAALDEHRWRVDELAEFLFGQFGMFGLVFFPLLVWVSMRGVRANMPMFLIFCWTFLLVICAQALFGRANANWAAPAYVAGSLVVAWWLVGTGDHLSKFRMRLFVLGVALNIALAVLVHQENTWQRLLNIPETAHNDWHKRLKGWHELGAQYVALHERYPAALPLSNERELMSELVYYARPWGTQMLSWNPAQLVRHHYDLVTTLADKNGRDFLWVGNDLPTDISRYFTEIKALGEIKVQVHPDLERRYSVYWLHDFKGYAHE